ncbi:MAG: response regulator [Propionicimonas sp.]
MYRVVLAEDQEFVRQAIAAMIRTDCQDFEVAGSYADGAEVLAGFDQAVPDIVLTDIKMPRLDGLHLARLLHQRYPRVKVIILSGYGEFEYARKAMSYGVSEYLLKPCRPEDLYGALRAAAAEIEEYRSLSRLAVRGVDAAESGSEPASGSESNADALLGRAVAHIREKYWTDLSLDDVARACYVSGRHLSRLLSEKLGASFTTLVTETRMERARELLRDPSYRVQEVATLVGYNDYRYFNYVFKKTTGQTPTAYRRSQPD